MKKIIYLKVIIKVNKLTISSKQVRKPYTFANANLTLSTGRTIQKSPKKT